MISDGLTCRSMATGAPGRRTGSLGAPPTDPGPLPVETPRPHTQNLRPLSARPFIHAGTENSDLQVPGRLKKAARCSSRSLIARVAPAAEILETGHHGDHGSAHPATAPDEGRKNQGAGARRGPPETRGVHPRLYHDTEEA